MSVAPDEPRTYTARWVFPVSGPPLPGGTVTVRGETIGSVDPHGDRRPDVDLGNTAIIPGLVNAHTHLDLSGARGLIRPTDPDHFTDWLRGVIAYRRTRTPEQTRDDVRTGLAECLRSGTTLLGDITADGGSWDVVAGSSVRGVVFTEVVGLTQAGVGRWEEAAGWVRRYHGRWAHCRPAVSPHAPYSVNAAVLMQSVAPGWPVTIHLAESPGELELLAARSGPFVGFLSGLGVWDGAVLAPSLEFVLKYTRGLGPVIYAHGNYLPADLGVRPETSVAYCARTHAAFCHPPHPFREFLGRGVRVCLGTDSLASNPDLDVLAEARFVHTRHPDFPGDTLLRMVTLAGAEALGWADETGSLDPGKSADFVVVPLPDRETGDPHHLLFADHPGDRRTMFRGVWRG
ncbi:MAG: metallo-dependent hydrolase family protein [Gemmataceae bacterium]|nr:metallo-dependent hydrolase family protein [Gemmataceae bacterium]